MNHPPAKGLLITVEGIDGSGKDTIARAIVAELERQGYTVFDLDNWSKARNALPLPQDAADAHVIFFSEPSYVWVGAAIREELIRKDTNYTARTIAEAFSLDRFILFTRFILPLRALGKIIIQQRHVSTSLIYQPLQDKNLTIETVAALPGNALEIKEAPDVILIASCAPEIAVERITGRSDKQDNAIFEKLNFLKQAHERYHSEWFKNFWTSHGTKLIYLDAAQPVAAMQTEAADIAKSFLKQNSVRKVRNGVRSS